MAMVFPLIVIVLSNLFYNICTKQTSENANTFLSLGITYIVAAVISFAAFAASGSLKDISQEIGKLNWASWVLGVCIIGLEAGYIWLYRAGWKISLGSLVANITLACVLLIVGVLFYKESLSVRQILGIIVCAAGLVMVCK